MWFPDSLQISKELIRAELEGWVPTGTIVATAAFTMESATTANAKSILEKYNLNREAGKVAWRFLQTGRIVTNDGEVVTGTEVASPAPSQAESPTEEPVSATYLVREKFRTYFPDFVDPTPQQCVDIMALAKEFEVLDNVLYTLANNGQDVKNPISLTLYILKNRSVDQIQQDRDMLDKKGRTSDSIVREAMRRAEAVIAQQPTPQATVEGLSKIRELREKVERARS